MTVYANEDLRHQSGVVSFTCREMGAEELASALGEKDIAVRAGLHCAPLAHETAGTVDTGTVRISFSDHNTPEEVAEFLDATGEILARKP